MFSEFNIVGNTKSKTLGRLVDLKPGIARRMMITAAITGAGLTLASSAFGSSITDVTSITAKPVTGSTTTVTGDTGGGNSSGFTSGHTYTMKYLGDDLKITKITAGSTSYV